LALCISKYQLPHYILVAFPLASIVTGKLVYDFIASEQHPKLSKVFAHIQTGVMALLFIGALLIMTVVFPSGAVGILLWVISVVIFIFILLRNKAGGKVLWVSATGIILINFFLTNYFYYPLLKYQCGSAVGKYLGSQNVADGRVWIWRVPDPLDCIHYYSHMVVPKVGEYNAPGKPGDYLLLMRDRLGFLDSAQRPYTILKEGRFFKVSELTLEFLNPRTRDSATQPYCLVLLN
jgi:hypothetical protein